MNKNNLSEKKSNRKQEKNRKREPKEENDRDSTRKLNLESKKKQNQKKNIGRNLGFQKNGSESVKPGNSIGVIGFLTFRDGWQQSQKMGISLVTLLSLEDEGGKTERKQI